jgi:fluoride exporter
MSNLLLVMLGGAIGAGFRYHVGRVALQNMGPGFPWGTLIVNLVGSLLIGVLAATMAADGSDERLNLFLGVGMLGGFTTFSAFSFETFVLLERGETMLALAYVMASVAGSLMLLIAAWSLIRLAS